jgi:hypothetical protein
MTQALTWEMPPDEWEAYETEPPDDPDGYRDETDDE